MSNFFTMLCYNFFRFILVLFHFAYSGFQYFNSRYTLLKRKLKNAIQLDYFDAQLFVSRFVTTLEKCPSHFLVIVGTDGINVEDFSNLVTWCLAAKISFVSFYDYSGKISKIHFVKGSVVTVYTSNKNEGYLKANQNIYYKYLIDKKKLDPKCLTFDLNKSNPKNKVLHRIHLNILSLEDGKPLFIQLAKNLTDKILSQELKISGINERIINENLYELSGIPEPELGVISGKICSTFGFSPWHVRVTEFLQIKNLKGIQVSEFTSILRKYSSCTQRFGK